MKQWRLLGEYQNGSFGDRDVVFIFGFLSILIIAILFIRFLLFYIYNKSIRLHFFDLITGKNRLDLVLMACAILVMAFSVIFSKMEILDPFKIGHHDERSLLMVDGVIDEMTEESLIAGRPLSYFLIKNNKFYYGRGTVNYAIHSYGNGGVLKIGVRYKIYYTIGGDIIKIYGFI